MKKLVLISFLFTTTFIYSQSKFNMEYVDISKLQVEQNSDLFKIKIIENEPVVLLEENIYNTKIDEFTGKIKDDAYGRVLLFGDKLSDYSMTIEMQFLGFNSDNAQNGGWFGIVFRAQDTDNYELVWFMPGIPDETISVAYISVAHGICPWWTEAYEKQNKGKIAIQEKEWFKARIDIVGDEFSVYVNKQFIFKKKICYYLKEGKAGLFVGTATDAAFRRLIIENISKEEYNLHLNIQQ
jgi:hypothetical protein